MTRPDPREASEAYANDARLIGHFRGAHEFLSNFYRAALRLDGVVYPSAEHAFNALKTADPDARERVRSAPTPSKAKAAGRRVKLRAPKAEWDSTLRYQVMREVIAAKFADPSLRIDLIRTGDALLIEGTGTPDRAWHDQTWGQCHCDKHRAFAGQNALGKALMDHRAYLRGEHRRWTRVAVTGHRPQHLDREQTAYARAELERLAAKLRADHHTQVAISGMAIGADTWWAEAAMGAGLDLWAYVPFWAQPGPWRADQRTQWERLVESAERRLVLGEEYDVRLLHSRNEFMIRDASLLIAVHDPAKTTGGTQSAIAKARAAGSTIVLVNVTARRTTIENPAARSAR